MLASQWCLKELAAAVNSGVPVLMIHKEGARWPLNPGAPMTENFPPRWLIDQLKPAACRAAFNNVPIEHSNHYFEAFRTSLLKRVGELIKDRKKKFRAIEDMAQHRKSKVAGG